MVELQRVGADHAAALLEFETANRAYFARSVSDRGDAYFEEFAQGHDALLADQEAGHGAYYVLLAQDGTVLGRVNLYVTGDGVANLGYRVAEAAAGCGLATEAVRELCRVAAARHGLTTVRAAAALTNPASGRVLRKAGFTEVGAADPTDLGGRPGTWFELDLGVS